jgi:uncharacterized membrane protein YcaP (DUF421 family)
MDAIIRAAVVYTTLLVIFRLAGKRALSQVTTFDLVLTLIISEAVQEALIDSDHSMTQAMILVLTLVGLDIAISLVKQRSELVEKIVNETPICVIEKGKVEERRLQKERVDLGDVLAAARQSLGISRLDQIEYAVVEPGGGVTIVPRRRARKKRSAAKQ